MTNVDAARKLEASTDGRAETIEPGARAGRPGGADITALERALHLARQGLKVRAKRRAEANRRGRTRKARRTFIEWDRALTEYKQAWPSLQHARRGAEESITGSQAANSAQHSGSTNHEPQSAVSLSTGSFEELRGLGMSVTQTRRVIRYREEHGPFKELNDLDDVSGFPAELVSRVKRLAAP